jgi:hypothetical protein
MKTSTNDPSLFFISFYTLPPGLATPMPTRIGAHIFPHGEVSFAKFLFLPSCLVKLLEANFSCFAKNI